MDPEPNGVANAVFAARRTGAREGKHMTVAGPGERGQRQRGTFRAGSLLQSRDPARDSAAVFVVRLSELAVQRRFFVEKDK